MISKLVSTVVLAATVAGVALPAAAQAKHYDRDGYQESRYDDDDDDRYERRHYKHERRGYAYGNGYQPRYYQSQRSYQPRYDDRRRYAQDYQPSAYYGDRSYRGDNSYGQQTRRCSNGTTGTILGAIAGGLVGNGIAGRGDRTLGAVLGGGAGALAGRAIDRNGNRC